MAWPYGKKDINTVIGEIIKINWTNVPEELAHLLIFSVAEHIT